MEVILKLTDVKQLLGEKPVKPIDVIDEALTTISNDIKRVDVLLSKGRKKIDLVGEVCNVEILIKE